MAQVTAAQLALLIELKGFGGWLILDSAKRLAYSPLEEGGYIGIQVINSSKFYCQITANGTALLDRMGSS
jgi:hypothetical protein